MFQVGDMVKLKVDAKDDLPLVVRAVKDANLFLCVSSCGNRRLWCCEFELELVETQTDLKQAIREVLLSEEFLAAFAKAWLKTPILHESELNLTVADDTRPYKSWDEIASECPPVTVNIDSLTITGSESEAYYLNKLKNGESK